MRAVNFFCDLTAGLVVPAGQVWLLFNKDPSVTFEAFDCAESEDAADDILELLPEEASAFAEESEAVPEEASELEEASFEAASCP